MSCAETASTQVRELAERLGIDDPDDALQRAIRRAVEDAEDDVIAYLGRPITPVTRTATGLWADLGGWGIRSDDPVRRIVSATPETITEGGQVITTGTFTVVYEVGLDYLADPDLRPIRRYVRAAALNSPELLLYVARNAGLRGPVQSVSASTEGQSKNVTYAQLGYGGGGAAGSDSPGALPSKTSMDTWRLAGRRVSQGRGRFVR